MTEVAQNVKVDPFDLLALEPQKVSTDMSSYTTMIYGPPKAGKTTFIHELYGTDAIFLRTEKGTKAIPGLFGIDIGKWSDLSKAKKQLKRKEVKQRFRVVVIDTIDNLYKYLEKYVKNKYGVDNLKEANGGWGAGHAELSDTLFDSLKEIESEGYQLAFISHSAIKTEKLPGSEEEYSKYIPSVPSRGLEIATKMVDNILFAYLAVNPETKQEQRVLYTRETLNFQAGTRFKNIPGALPMSAQAFKDAMTKAIESLGPENLKTEREVLAVETEELDFEEMMKEAKQIAVELHKAGRMNEVTVIVEKYLGQGKLLRDATAVQVETVAVVLDELRDLVKTEDEPEETEE
jgi:AAA domain